MQVSDVTGTGKKTLVGVKDDEKINSNKNDKFEGFKEGTKDGVKDGGKDKGKKEVIHLYLIYYCCLYFLYLFLKNCIL